MSDKVAANRQSDSTNSKQRLSTKGKQSETESGESISQNFSPDTIIRREPNLSLSQTQILALQRTIGNQAVLSMLAQRNDRIARQFNANQFLQRAKPNQKGFMANQNAASIQQWTALQAIGITAAQVRTAGAQPEFNSAQDLLDAVTLYPFLDDIINLFDNYGYDLATFLALNNLSAATAALGQPGVQNILEEAGQVANITPASINALLLYVQVHGAQALLVANRWGWGKLAAMALANRPVKYLDTLENWGLNPLAALSPINTANMSTVSINGPHFLTDHTYNNCTKNRLTIRRGQGKMTSFWPVGTTRAAIMTELTNAIAAYPQAGAVAAAYQANQDLAAPANALPGPNSMLKLEVQRRQGFATASVYVWEFYPSGAGVHTYSAAETQNLENLLP